MQNSALLYTNFIKLDYFRTYLRGKNSSCPLTSPLQVLLNQIWYWVIICSVPVSIGPFKEKKLALHHFLWKMMELRFSEIRLMEQKNTVIMVKAVERAFTLKFKQRCWCVMLVYAGWQLLYVLNQVKCCINFLSVDGQTCWESCCCGFMAFMDVSSDLLVCVVIKNRVQMCWGWLWLVFLLGDSQGRLAINTNKIHFARNLHLKFIFFFNGNIHFFV